MAIKIPITENRTLKQLREHYEIEKKLANRLRNATQAERKYLYNSLYDELFRRVPHHPQLTRKVSSKISDKKLAQRMRFLNGFLSPDAIFLEIGAGDCRLAFEIAKRVKKIYAIDTSKEIVVNESCPKNFELIIFDGVSIPVPESSISIAYSDQLMEHLHAEDAFEQLGNVYKALKKTGIYISITPNRLSGPHDISKYFDPVATGFHLKEYTNIELMKLFRKVGFSKVAPYMDGRLVPNLAPLIFYETLLGILPHYLRTKVLKKLSYHALFSIVRVGEK